MHGGPFGNIAHGCNSVVATRTAASRADFVVTEAGFGFDLGAEKFFDIKCRSSGLWPSAVVLVVTTRALRIHGGGNAQEPSLDAVMRGLEHLDHHVHSVRTFGFEPVIAINVFDHDSEDEPGSIETGCETRGLKFARFTGFTAGGAGAEILAQQVVDATQRPAPAPHFLDTLDQSPQEKITAVAQTIYVFEMATGTGKTLTAAAVIKLFLRTGNVRRVLFLVDRIEVEDQANKAFKFLLKNDYTSVIYKERRNEWRRAGVVVTTVQSLLFNNKYKRLFSPTDFDLVISDEAHRSIGGNARAVFEYFVGYKLGLTATPKDYLKQFDENKPTTRDPSEQERRLLLDTYRTFGCEKSQPTYRYSLLDGVKDGYLINPTVVDTEGNVTIPDRTEKVGLNVYRKK